MFRYRYQGETARSIPALGLDDVQPGDVVEVPVEINNPDFVLVKDAPAKSSAPAKSDSSKENA